MNKNMYKCYIHTIKKNNNNKAETIKVKRIDYTVIY